MNIGRFAGSSVIFRNAFTSASLGFLYTTGTLKYLIPGRLDRRLLVRGAMLGRLPQVEQGLHAVSLELGKGLETRLGAGAELWVHLEELWDCRRLGLCRGLGEGGEQEEGEHLTIRGESNGRQEVHGVLGFRGFKRFRGSRDQSGPHPADCSVS
jgi:hypothetical protein